MMRCETLILAVVATALASSPPARAQSASELLEKGIFTEETVGDLDAAIKIYEQIVAEAVKNRSYAAQAQYRLAMCYLKRGGKDEAVAALQKLVVDFPKQKELVAQARTRLSALGHPISEVSGGARHRLVLDDALANLLAGQSGFRGGDYDFSPDGEKIVFLAPWELEQVNAAAHGQGARNGTGWAGLYVSDRSGTVIRRLFDMERPMEWLGSPSWSPDGRLIAFGAEIPPSHAETSEFVPALFVVGPDGGAPRQIGPAPLPGEGRGRGVCWTRDSRHLTYARADGLYTMDLDGNIVRFIDRKSSRFMNLGGYSPNGRWLAFSEPNKDDGMDVWLVGSTGGDAVRVTDGTVYAAHPTWAPDGHAIYFVSRRSPKSPDANVWRLELDPQSGAAGSKIKQVTSYSDARIGYPTVLPGGNALAFVLSKRNHVINVADASRPEAARALVRGKSPSLSPDGQTLYYTGEGPGQTGIFALNRQGGPPRRLTPARPMEGEFDLSPDGRAIAYAALIDGKAAFFTVSVQGGEPRLLASSDSRSGAAPRWSPDGERLAYAHDDGLYVIPATGGQTPSRIAQLANWEPWSVRWSPDGRYVAAFGYGESEKENSIFVVPASGGEPRRLTAYDGIYKEGLGWHPDGQRITYHLSQSHSMTYQAFLDGRPPSLFLDHPDSWDYIGEWTPDGRRFFFSGSAEGEWRTFVYDTESGDVRLFREHSGLPIWSRDGRTIAWSSDTTTRQLWLMENFLQEPKVAVASGVVTRQVWAPALDTEGGVSPDGRYLSYVHWDTGNLALRDLTTGENRHLTSKRSWADSDEFAQASRVSPDGKQVAYAWYNEEFYDLRIVGLDGSEPRVLYANEEVSYLQPAAWSPDGTRILFASDRTDTMSAWLIRVAEGKPQGSPELIRKDMGRINPIGFTRNGSFYYSVESGIPDVYTATLDLGTGKFLAPATKVTQRFVGTNFAPDWSSDGKYLLYLSQRGRLPHGMGSRVLVIRSLESGKERVLSPKLAFHRAHSLPRWSPDGRSILVTGHDLKGRLGCYRIDAQTGEVTSHAQSKPSGWGEIARPVWSADGKAILFQRGPSLVVRDLDSGQEKVLHSCDHIHAWALSPDGRQVALAVPSKDQAKDGARRAFYSNVLLVMPATGGETRELFRVPAAEEITAVVWTPDGRQLLFCRASGPLYKEEGLWRIRAEGGEPQVLALDLTGDQLGSLRFHPDGARIAFAAGERKEEVWVLENFLPEPTATP